MEVGEGALRFLDHHLFEIEHDPDAGACAVGQQLVHVLEPVKELLAGGKDGVARHGHADESPHRRSGHLHDPPLDGEHLLQPPLSGLRQ